MMSTLDKAIESLRDNDRQWAAYNHRGHCAVIAPPGSGKTHLLSTRVASDLRDFIDRPRGAACITLTNPAASELRNRIRSLSAERRSTLFIGTVHSFALSQVVRPYAHLTSYADLVDRTIASPDELSSSWEEAIHSVYGGSDSAQYAQSTVNFYRKRIVPPADWNDERLVAVSNEQRRLLRVSGRVELDEIVEAAVGIVRESEVVRHALSCRFPMIYVDEYQDLAPHLDLLVRALCLEGSGGSTLFGVGDPNQAIYGWTGTRAELLFNLAETQGVRRIDLRRNYRCGNGIIRVADLLRSDSTEPIEGDDGGSVSAIRVPGLIEGQSRAAAAEISTALANGTQLHEIAVLCLTKYDCNEAAEALKLEGIPYSVRAEDYRQTPATMLIEAFCCWVSYGREASGYRLGELLDQMRLVSGNRPELVTESAIVGTLLQANPQSRADALVDKLIEAGLDGGISRRGNGEADELARMLASLEKGPLSNATVADLGSRARRNGRVEISTMSSSKGLEFEVVIILGADQDRIPHYRSRDDAEKTAEDRRKVYVSVTRARRIVKIFYSGYAITSRGRRVDCGPSQFLREMKLA